MAQEVLMRQARGLSNGSGHSLEDAKEAVSDTEAGRQLRDLASGEHRHERAQDWQASVFWEHAEERFMHRIGSEVIMSSFVAESHTNRGQGASQEATWRGLRKASRSERSNAHA
jgi:hypothetical protein